MVAYPTNQNTCLSQQVQAQVPKDPSDDQVSLTDKEGSYSNSDEGIPPLEKNMNPLTLPERNGADIGARTCNSISNDLLKINHDIWNVSDLLPIWPIRSTSSTQLPAVIDSQIFEGCEVLDSIRYGQHTKYTHQLKGFPDARSYGAAQVMAVVSLMTRWILIPILSSSTQEEYE
ncbi:hypothetical protein CRG98_003276 [Punica granatum]|uniref:Uncharacterized protein n=1 Tax=Punica granatum TaxID=22663 RepID=A0A2I0L6N2_PUNGR|nr:hypothetical protein CRG98_003276 [Punica granatum]